MPSASHSATAPRGAGVRDAPLAPRGRRCCRHPSAKGHRRSKARSSGPRRQAAGKSNRRRSSNKGCFINNWAKCGGKCTKYPPIFLLLQAETVPGKGRFTPQRRRLRTEIPAGTGGDICGHERGYRCGRPSTRLHNQQAYRQLRKRHHPSDFNHTAL